MLPAEWKSPCYGSHVKKHDTQHLIGRIVFLTRGKSNTRHLIGCRVLRPACEPNLFRAFSMGKSQYIYNKWFLRAIQTQSKRHFDDLVFKIFICLKYCLYLHNSSTIWPAREKKTKERVHHHWNLAIIVSYRFNRYRFSFIIESFAKRTWIKAQVLQSEGSFFSFEVPCKFKNIKTQVFLFLFWGILFQFFSANDKNVMEQFTL